MFQFFRSRDDEEETTSPDAPSLGNQQLLTPQLGGEKAAARYVQALAENKQRPRAIKALVELGEVAVTPLIDALDHPDRHVRDAAAFTLGRIKDRRAVVPLLPLLKDDAAHVRKITAYALGYIEDIRAVPALMHTLRDRDQAVIEAATYSLSRMDWPDDLLGIVETWGD